MASQINAASRAANEKMAKAESIEKTNNALLAIVHSVRDQMVPALVSYIAAIQMLANIFKELKDETTHMKEGLAKMEGQPTKRAILFFKTVLKNSGDLYINLRGVIQTFDSIKPVFTALAEFSHMEGEFTAKLVGELKKEIEKGRDVVKKDNDRKKLLNGWCKKLDSIKIS